MLLIFHICIIGLIFYLFKQRDKKSKERLLNDLYNEGILTEDEYFIAKERILAS